MNTKTQSLKILAGPIPLIECGCCGCFHRTAYHGDCRNDSERFDDIQDAETRMKRKCVEVFEDEPMPLDASALFYRIPNPLIQ